jgi:glycosyltransferase involved in cell wall biosynthesis
LSNPKQYFLNNLKILYVSPYYEPAYYYGGPVNSSASLCKALVSEGHSVSVLTTNANKPIRLQISSEQPVNIHGVQVWNYPLVTDFYFYSPQFVRAIKENIPNFDFIFLQAFWTHAFVPAARTALQNKIPYVVPMRGQLLPWSLKQKALRKKLYLWMMGYHYLNKAAGLYCTDKYEEEYIKKLGIISPTFIIYNIVDQNFFTDLPQKGYFQKIFNIPEKSYTVILLGRLHHKKRPDLAIKAIPTELIQGKEVHLLIAGPDQENLVQKLKEYSSAMRLEDKIHFTGSLSREKVIQALVDSDLLIMPSEPNSENFGMAAAEALAVGIPVLTTKGVPIGELAVKNNAGKTVEFSPDNFKNTLSGLLQSPDKLKEMGRYGQQLARREFTSKTLAKKMVNQIKTIITE